MDTASPSVTFPSATKAKGGVIGKLSRTCAANATLCLALIVILIIIIIVMYVYYHGLFGLGPYSEAKTVKKGGGRKRKSGFNDDEPGSAASDDKADPETERLIDTINSQ